MTEKQHQRATWHNYHERGIYMLTLVTEDRTAWFGQLKQDASQQAFVEKNVLGAAVEECLRQIPEKYPEVEVMHHVLMPDHLHVLLYVHEAMRQHLGEVVRNFKYETTATYLNLLNKYQGGIHRVKGSRPSKDERERQKAERQQDQNSLATSAEKPPTTEPKAGLVSGGFSATANSAAADIPPSPPSIIPAAPLWASGYHDRVLMGRNQLHHLLRYIDDNPRRAWIKHTHRHLFYNKAIRDLPISIEAARELYKEARSMGLLPSLNNVLIINKADEETTTTSLRMKGIGNWFLMDEGLLQPVRVSRRITPPALAALKAELFGRCEREGAILITPAISQGEREVVREALQAGFRVVLLQLEAMSDLFAPTRFYMDFLSRGQLLLLAPWPEQATSIHGDKGRFELMNALCRTLAVPLF